MSRVLKDRIYLVAPSMSDLYAQLIDSYDQMKYALLDAQTFDQNHYGFPPLYYKIMETDQTRVTAFVKAFQQYDNMQEAVVCEVGVGTLALTKHFLPYVKKAYLIESNPSLQPFIVQEIHRLGYDDKVELIFADALSVQLPEPVDYLIGELMSIYCANELQVQIFKHMRQFLKPWGRLLPEKIINLAQLCTASFEEDHRHYPVNFTRHLPEFLSLPQVIDTIDMSTVQETHRHVQSIFEPLFNGQANAVYIQSFVQISSGSNFTWTDSLMPPTVCALRQPTAVHIGQPVKLVADFAYGTSLDEALFSLV